MTKSTIIMDTNTLSNLYFSGGTLAWDKLLEQYDTVVITDVVHAEMTTNTNHPRGKAFKEWMEKNIPGLQDEKDKNQKDNVENKLDMQTGINGLERHETKSRRLHPAGTKNLGEKSIAEVADGMIINKGIRPIIASDENDFFRNANASDQVKTITPIKTPEIMNAMLDKNTITPKEYQDWAKNSDTSKGSQFKKEDFRDLSKPYDRTIERMDAAREIRDLEPKAKAEADQALEAVLKDTSPEAAAKVARAEKEKDWVEREGTVSVLHEKLAEVEKDTFTVRVEPGATSIGRLQALSNGIDAEVVRQQQEQARVVEPVRSVPEAGKPTPGAERSGPEMGRER